ncbi:hypothetical protein VPHD479_0098 [Vibrio phage D479]
MWNQTLIVINLGWVYAFFLALYTIKTGRAYFRRPGDTPQIVIALMGWALFIFAWGVTP